MFSSWFFLHHEMLKFVVLSKLSQKLLEGFPRNLVNIFMSTTPSLSWSLNPCRQHKVNILIGLSTNIYKTKNSFNCTSCQFAKLSMLTCYCYYNDEQCISICSPLHMCSAMWTCLGTQPWWEHCFVIHKKESLVCKQSPSPRLSVDPQSLSWSCYNWNCVYCQVSPANAHTHTQTHQSWPSDSLFFL